MRSSDSADLNLAVARYLRFLEQEKRRSPHTVMAAQRDLNLIADLGWGVTDHDLRLLLSKRRSAGAAASSLNRIVSSWRGFFKFLVDAGDLDSNPAQALKTPKKPSRLPKVVGMDQLQAVLLKPLAEKDIGLARAQVLVELLYFSGLRVSEAVALKWANEGVGSLTHWVCLARGELQVLGKGGKSRVVPLTRVLIRRLGFWRDHWKAYAGTRGVPVTHHVFQSNTGKSFTARMAQKDVERFGLAMNLGQHLHPHMLRHSFGSHLLQESQNLRGVQDLLGHASIASTQVYTTLDFKHLAQVYDSSFPRSKKDN